MHTPLRSRPRVALQSSLARKDLHTTVSLTLHCCDGFSLHACHAKLAGELKCAAGGAIIWHAAATPDWRVPCKLVLYALWSGRLQLCVTFFVGYAVCTAFTHGAAKYLAPTSLAAKANMRVQLSTDCFQIQMLACHKGCTALQHKRDRPQVHFL